MARITLSSNGPLIGAYSYVVDIADADAARILGWSIRQFGPVTETDADGNTTERPRTPREALDALVDSWLTGTIANVLSAERADAAAEIQPIPMNVVRT
jgi:hypothetical protein